MSNYWTEENTDNPPFINNPDEKANLVIKGQGGQSGWVYQRETAGHIRTGMEVAFVDGQISGYQYAVKEQAKLSRAMLVLMLSMLDDGRLEDVKSTLREQLQLAAFQDLPENHKLRKESGL